MQNIDTENRIRILQDYVNLVVLRDIVERHEIINIALVRTLIKTLLGTAGNLFSVNKILGLLLSEWVKVSFLTTH